MKIEINKEEREEVIDWDKPQFVYSTKSNTVFYVFSDIDQNYFEGVVVGGDSMSFYSIVNNHGYFAKEQITKKHKIPFKGSITLSNY